MHRGSVSTALSFSLLAVVAAAVGCTPGAPDLFVELKTDLVPGAEFTRVRTVVLPAGGTGAGREQDAPAIASADYLVGLRVGEFQGLETGDYAVRVELFGPNGRQFIERTVRMSFRQSSGMVVVITRSCQGVTCPAPAGDATLTQCLGGRCVDPTCAVGDEDSCGEIQCEDVGDCPTPAACAVATCDTGVCLDRPLLDGCGEGDYCDASVGCLPLPTATDAGPRDGGVDAADSAPAGCTADAACDDGLECTIDRCVAGTCEVTTDDGACTAGTGGLCIAGFGCQYDGCSPSTCVAGPCERARCDGDSCVIENACTSAEMCCGDACVALGCDDGNPCTDDSCGAAGCDNNANAAGCDDGVFCNGTDTCGGGACTVHGGDPCSAGTTCSEPSDTCVGCLTDSDCPADMAGPWGACGGFSDTCDETGTRSRTVTSFSCGSGTCTGADRMETEACSRTTGGLTCGTTTFSGWGACGGFSGTCGETGTRTRTRTDRICGGGTCGNVNSDDTGSCVQDTDGNSCGTTTYGSWSACGGFGSTCDTTGTRTRSETTYTCTAGSCTTSSGTDTGSCTRSTNGTSCGSTTYGPWGACGGYSSTCDQTGTRSRSATAYTCSAGSCSGSTGSDTGSCSRSTDGTSCDATTYGAWSACGGYSNTCDETGTRTRSQTDYACSSGSCSGSSSTDTGSCTRDTDGTTCGTTTYGAWGACGGYSSSCDQTGTRSRTQTDYTCTTGSCSPQVGSDTGSCTRNTNGNYCTNFPGGCQNGSCSGGSCNLVGTPCNSPSRCCEPGICVCSGCSCP